MVNVISGPSGAAPDRALAAKLNAHAAAIKMLQEQKVRIPEAAAGGGAMQGFTRATPGATSATAFGFTFTGWSFDTSADLSPGLKPGLTQDGSQHFGVVRAGLYSTHVRAQVTLSGGSPAGVLVQANDGFSSTDGVSYYGEAWAMNLIDGRYRTDFWCGPFWLAAGDMPLGISVATPGSPTVGTATAFIDVWRVG